MKSSCYLDTNVSSNAAVAFLGTTVTSNDDTLALQSSAAGSAQNVGIQILDRTEYAADNQRY